MSRVVSGALWRMKKALRDWWRSKGLSGGELCRPGEERSRALECLPSGQTLIRNDLPQSSLLSGLEGWMSQPIRRNLPILQGETSLMADGVARSIGEHF